VAAVLILFAAIATSPAAEPQIPALQWEKRSDWRNVASDVSPPALGDGKADDTAAIQNALDALTDGSVLYFPPGTYRVTKTLSVRNAKSGRLIGALLVGSGRDTRLVWDGPAGGTMVLIDGLAYSRIVGFEFDGRKKASIGLHYEAAKGFGTEVTHRHLAFRGFTDSAVYEKHPNSGQALAETSFENCLFENCGRGVTFLQFNDYDYTFDGCEFRNCGVGIDCARGNFYVRNCHFEGSREVDIRDWSEHSSSIRRCTSVGSKAFVTRITTIAPLTVQDCHVQGWKDPAGALLLSRPPVMLFDCVFTEPPKGEQGQGLAPVRVHSEGQRLIVSGNRVEGAPELTNAGSRPMLNVVPDGKLKGVIRSASQSFLHETTRIPKRVFDAKRDFSAVGNGMADDTEAIQRTIDAAAAAGNDAVAYLPSGSYVLTRPLSITGRNYFVGGSGWGTKLAWKGADGGTMVEVRDPQDVVLEDMMIGSHDVGEMKNAIDVHQTGSGAGSRMTYDGVYAFGMYQKQPLKKGMRFTNLGAKDVVLMPHVQGNLRFVDCAAATILVNTSYEGSVTTEGKGKERGGLLGFQTRLATVVTHGLYVRDNQNIVMSDFYVESADNGYLFEGSPDLPPGQVTIQGAKVHFPTSNDPAKNTAFEINNYHGQIFFGPDQFYGEPKQMRIRQKGDSAVELFLLGCSWYNGPQPDIQIGPAARVSLIANESYGQGKDGEPAPNAALFSEAASASALEKVSAALDDLRRLGEADLRLNHSRAAGGRVTSP